MKTLTLAGLAFIIGSTTAMAATPLVDQRQQDQLRRIYNGVQSGEITFGEFVKSLRGQAYIYRTEHRYKANGVVTPAERARLNLLQTKQDFPYLQGQARLSGVSAGTGPCSNPKPGIVC